MTEKPTLIVAANFPAFKTGIAEFLRKTYSIIECKTNFNSLLIELIKQPNAPVIISTTFSGLNIFTSCEYLKKHHPNNKVVLCSLEFYHPAVKLVQQGFCAAYLLKTSESGIFCHAVNSAKTIGHFFSPDVYTKLAATATDPVLHFRPERYKVFYLLACGFNYDEIAEAVPTSKDNVYKCRQVILKTLNFTLDSEVAIYAMANGHITLADTKYKRQLQKSD